MAALRRVEKIHQHLAAAVETVAPLELTQTAGSAKKISQAEWKNLVGKEVGVSEYLLVDQKMVDAFADVTQDPQWIHRADAGEKGSPFGGPIAHGFLILSLVTKLSESALPTIEGAKMGVNYGLNKVRFVSPVKVGSRIRAKAVLKALEGVTGGLQNTLEFTIQAEGSNKPACVIEWLTRVYL